jgi:hypothetical protein
MGKMYFKRIRYKGKMEFLYDPKGNYIYVGGEFKKVTDNPKKKDPEEQKLKKELTALFKLNPYLKKRVKHIKNLAKKVYYAKAWFLTEKNDLTVLKNHEKRGFRKWNLDHIFPISAGFKRGIPPEIVANIKNLRFIPHKQNMKKRDEVIPEAETIINQILKEYNN